jgi:hypothetical protein
LDFSRFPSDFDDKRGLEEILFFNANLTETEFLEDFHQALGVRLINGYKEINIARVSRKSVKADGVASNDKILNGLFFQQRNEVEKVGIQVFHRRGFDKLPPWRQGVPGELISTKDFRAREGFPKDAWRLFFQSAW